MSDKDRGLRLQSGFTLIEVLLALAVIAIALTALLQATAQNIQNTQRIKEKTMSHWIGMQGITMIQMNLIQVTPGQESTQLTTFINQNWYWKAKINPTPIKNMQEISIVVSRKQSGPFEKELFAYRYAP